MKISELSFVRIDKILQLEGDLKQLEAQKERVSNELKIGVPKVFEEKGEAASEPLRLRLTRFLMEAERTLGNIKTQQAELTERLQRTMSK